MRIPVTVIHCGAKHDLDGLPNKPFGHCRRNIICSHGNHVLDRAVDVAERQSLISAGEAERMRQVLEITRIELQRGVDGPATNGCGVCTGRFSYDPEAEQMIAGSVHAVLGPDPARWPDILRQRQAERAQPIIDIAVQLRDLGVLNLLKA